MPLGHPGDAFPFGILDDVEEMSGLRWFHLVRLPPWTSGNAGSVFGLTLLGASRLCRDRRHGAHVLDWIPVRPLPKPQSTEEMSVAVCGRGKKVLPASGIMVVVTANHPRSRST